MFLKYVKDFFVKKALKKGVNKLENVVGSSEIKTVGLLIDISYFSEIELIVKNITAYGIGEKNIKILAYKDKIGESKFAPQPTFGYEILNWKGEITDSKIVDFTTEKFDLLISCYELEKAILLKITNDSIAKFKVGFTTIDKRFNHLTINTALSNQDVFIEELFRYLKKLKKI
jgi:hypothetical protein